MAGYRDTSIKRKLMLVIVCTSVLGLSLACMAFEIYERSSFRESMVSGLAANADSLGLATAASIASASSPSTAKSTSTPWRRRSPCCRTRLPSSC